MGIVAQRGAALAHSLVEMKGMCDRNSPSASERAGAPVMQGKRRRGRKERGMVGHLVWFFSSALEGGREERKGKTGGRPGGMKDSNAARMAHPGRERVRVEKRGAIMWQPIWSGGVISPT